VCPLFFIGWCEVEFHRGVGMDTGESSESEEEKIEAKIKEPLLNKLKRALVRAGDDEAIYNIMLDKPLDTLKLIATLEPKQIKHETDFRIHWVEAPKKEPLPVIDIQVIDELEQIAEEIEDVNG
jgi:hypothetical protein